MPNITIGFGNLAAFELTQRIAKMFANSGLVPEQYRAVIRKKTGRDEEYVENPAAIPNCVIALNMAQRLNADPLMVMQNLHIVEGRPSWSAQFMVAAANSCGRFTPIKYRVTRGEEREVEYVVTGWRDGANGRRERYEEKRKARVPDLRCVAYAHDKATGELLESPEVSIEMALAEGWYQRAGSKWQTPMREQMIRYRAATFFCRLYSPELLMGLPSTDEAVEILDAERDAQGEWAIPDTEPPAAPVEEPQPQAESAAAPEQPTGAPTPQGGQEAPGNGQGHAQATAKAQTQPPANAKREPPHDPVTGEVLGAEAEGGGGEEWPVVIDQQTGQERPATPEEAAELRAMMADPAAQEVERAAREHEARHPSPRSSGRSRNSNRPTTGTLPLNDD
ncbi:recombinase family protein [Rhodovastum atsumiense]|uniref:Recombinase RecT n=1 Tax=Rhodovastum atsumiense TaxID=504468 RepID=A0A5M6ITC1_9PROT|nr:hypothetical protein [Rhodovastum atsumiense]KAA5611564.1 hypothetical protein F1189_13445 [Rhodovastum atsumiense]